ncbi:DUF2484 family protein [Algicella marina]|uniref:DUF2484 family protein n=1 Tax=Algicella marina TaxID=2683284 RepID=A0A6P1SXJ3_9RHOB|nr:DUF2484 family protein [Algicella marina]QHQ34053.1 DUF2484 family protein [Algicella marina]
MLSALLTLCWLILANVIAMFPSRSHHWPAAYVLMSIGVPLLVLVYKEHGPGWAGLALLGMVSILRWPVRYFIRWVRRKLGNEEAGL